jgi:hypothetical protein
MIRVLPLQVGEELLFRGTHQAFDRRAASGLGRRTVAMLDAVNAGEVAQLLEWNSLPLSVTSTRGSRWCRRT